MTWLWRRFEALLEREWLQAGHPFADRCAKSAFANSKLRQESPVFLLFLDCAWQVRQELGALLLSRDGIYSKLKQKIVLLQNSIVLIRLCMHIACRSDHNIVLPILYICLKSIRFHL